MKDEILIKIKDYLEALVKINLIRILENEFKDSKFKTIYELTGVKSIKEISKKVNISTGAISNLWARWENLGILIKEGKRYRKVV